MGPNHHLEQLAGGLGPVPDDKLAIFLNPQEPSVSPRPLPLPLLHSLKGSKAAIRPIAGIIRSKQTTVSKQLKAAFETQPWLAQALSSRWESYRARLDECRQHPSADSVHELRVSIRRLTAQVTLFGSIRVSRSAQKAQRILKRQFGLLGPLRDHHVQRIFIEQKAEKFPELLILQGHLQRREGKLIKAVSREVNQFRSRKLGRWIHLMVADLTENSNRSLRNDKLTSLAMGRANDAFAETVQRRRLIDLSDSKTIHRTRVAFKRFRYLVECLPYEVTGFTKRDLRQLAHYQRKMGGIQDLEVIRASISQFIPRYEGADCLLAPFCSYLRMRSRRALRSFNKSADKLFQLWPPRAGSAEVQSAANQYAA
jgi:CHAD domain-containing protein